MFLYIIIHTPTGTPILPTVWKLSFLPAHIHLHMHASPPTCFWHKHTHIHTCRRRHTSKGKLQWCAHTEGHTHTACSRFIKASLTFVELPQCPIFSPCSPSCIQLFYPPPPLPAAAQLCLAPFHLRTAPYTYLTCKLRLYLCHAQEVLSISLNTVTHLLRRLSLLTRRGRREGEGVKKGREREWQWQQDQRKRT